MNRALCVMALGLLVTMSGCAADVDDPVPPAPVEEEQREPPKQTLNTQIRDPQAQLIAAMEIDHGMNSLPVKQLPHWPGPLPETDE